MKQRNRAREEVRRNPFIDVAERACRRNEINCASKAEIAASSNNRVKQIRKSRTACLEKERQ